RRPLRDRQVSRPSPERGERGLEVQGNRIVDEGAHTLLFERGHDRVTARVADHEQMIDGARVRLLAEDPQGTALELARVDLAERAAPLRPVVEVLEPDPEHRRL